MQKIIYNCWKTGPEKHQNLKYHGIKEVGEGHGVHLSPTSSRALSATFPGHRDPVGSGISRCCLLSFHLAEDAQRDAGKPCTSKVTFSLIQTRAGLHLVLCSLGWVIWVKSSVQQCWEVSHTRPHLQANQSIFPFLQTQLGWESLLGDQFRIIQDWKRVQGSRRLIFSSPADNQWV